MESKVYEVGALVELTVDKEVTCPGDGGEHNFLSMGLEAGTKGIVLYHAPERKVTRERKANADGTETLTISGAFVVEHAVRFSLPPWRVDLGCLPYELKLVKPGK